MGELGNLVHLTGLGLLGNQLGGCLPSSFLERLREEESDVGGFLFCPWGPVSSVRSATSAAPRCRPRRPHPEGETAVRTTGLLTARRNPGDRTDPVCQPLTTEGNNVTFEGQLPLVRWTVA